MRKGVLISVMFVLTFSVYAKDDAKLPAAQSAVIPTITGGFSFKQYVTVKAGDKEVLGDEGVIYISPNVFTTEELANIGRTMFGKHATYGDTAGVYFHQLNTCITAIPQSSGKAGDAAGYLSHVLTTAHNEKNTKGIWLRLYTSPDYWYTWHVEPSDHGFVVDDSGAKRAWGWDDSRVVFTRDPSVNLQNCLDYWHSQHK